MSRIFEHITTGIYTVILLVLLGGAALLVMGGILMIPLAFPLMTVGGVFVVVIWFGSAWLSKKRKKSKLRHTLKRECGERG
ncbi:hypothetical protein EOI86_12090 [Hwanghaeella grinnelliae]|uniref:Uncharacterized protein n=1 Tax=Hwanghaeella grinnelliae TaxID=2500179 RepID=A0A3S2Z6V8_9PROT|nr:hypothetical protein [Hwanghaeella grinnelliae]RVU35983.1 hypothetical protein EOI86_12090 [Hwanghaeella grinnelliae]